MPLLGFDVLSAALHVFAVVTLALVLVFVTRRRKWLASGVALLLWIGLAEADFLLSGGSLYPGVYAAYLVAMGIPLAVALVAVLLSRRVGLSHLWQAAVGTAAGTAAMLPWTVYLLVFGCLFTHDCI